MMKQDIYLINIVRAPFKLSNLKQPIYYGQKLLQITPALLSIMIILITYYCKIITTYEKKIYYKLRQLVITNHASFITNYDKNLLQITTKSYYKLRQLLFLKNSKLLQITSSFITYYSSLQCYYKLRKFLLQITAGITDYDVITNYVITIISSNRLNQK